ncbi:hypothetical protein GCM10028796_25730 [Ramlibacter monticola]|uniref:Uncharacterized protein n=1 Tax=Ramlibacter monticola TaxID=1926872 RepID=A0A936Z4A0_9BURK|nr:hypothetical protein [Ramlibacter monticola]MBL0393629.1 hypothetical protein [Ramlibacter monticola]
MLTPDDITDAGFYWYLDAMGSAPQVIEVVGQDVLMVRFCGREDEDALAELAGTLVGPLRPPGAWQALNEVENKAVQAALSRLGGRVPGAVKEDGEGHPC